MVDRCLRESRHFIYKEAAFQYEVPCSRNSSCVESKRFLGSKCILLKFSRNDSPMAQKNNTQPASGAWFTIATFIPSLCKHNDFDYAKLILWFIVLRTPEVFEIIPKTVKVTARKNLAQVSKVLTQIITARHFGDDQPTFMPINDFVQEASGRMCTWLLEGVINILSLGKCQ